MRVWFFFFRVQRDWAAAAQANKTRVGKLFARHWRVAVFFGIVYRGQLHPRGTRLFRQAGRQRAGALPPPPELPLSVLVSCRGAENVFVRGRLWEEADRRLAVRRRQMGVSICA